MRIPGETSPGGGAEGAPGPVAARLGASPGHPDHPLGQPVESSAQHEGPAPIHGSPVGSGIQPRAACAGIPQRTRGVRARAGALRPAAGAHIACGIPAGVRAARRALAGVESGPVQPRRGRVPRTPELQRGGPQHDAAAGVEADGPTDSNVQ